MKSKHRILRLGIMLMLMLALFPMTVLAAEETAAPQPAMYATCLALVPPIVAIGLALITKEVYSSLFIGITISCGCIIAQLLSFFHVFIFDNVG